MIESLSHKENSSRFIYIIKPTTYKNEFTVGSNYDCDLRIDDISVSPVHARIKLVNG